MASNFEKLQTLLSELFQLDQADLDFGIYRIMNQKREEITRFLNKELLPQVKAAFAQYQPVDKKALETELEQAVHGARALGFDPDQAPKVKELRDQLALYSVDTAVLENEVYSHLYSFFRRYYDKGDFISMRRYKEGVYAIPYEGEEVKLHWANADQYYVKTAEYFRDYNFKLPSGRVAHFKIVEADAEKDNIKAASGLERRFILAAEAPVQVEDGALVMHFEYHPDAEKRDQKALNSLALETILAQAPAEWVKDISALSPTESNPKRTMLEKHLIDYTARNTFDYFIHKDLGGFLHRELDFYIKNEVIRLDDIENENVPRIEQYLSKIKVLRQIAHKIITFLAQIEDFQKKLWLKKKFVIETNYCITLDRIPEEFYPEICANAAQHEEWVRLFSIDEIKADLLTPGYSVPLRTDFLKANPFLVLDTIFFDEGFVNKLLAKIDHFDSFINGLLIHGENFNAAMILKYGYENRVKSIYLDPPFNTSEASFIYKNEYKHSSWLAMLDQILNLCKQSLASDGLLAIAIDDAELCRLNLAIEAIFGPNNYLGSLVVQNNPRGRTINSFFATCHEYCIVFSKDINQAQISHPELTADQESAFSLEDDIGKYRLLPFRRSGGLSTPDERPNSYYPIYYDEISNKISAKEFPNSVAIYPIDGEGNKRVWRFTNPKIKPSVIDAIAKGDLLIKKHGDTFTVNLKDRVKSGRKPKTIWYDSKYDASSHGTILINNILGEAKTFSYPKSIYTVQDMLEVATKDEEDAIIVDYFAGSGTTGHAVINLNREDDGHRRYVLVEMGVHFNTVLLPRIKKVIYSSAWKKGQPIKRDGVSQCFKYIRLESYEDTLNNLTLKLNKAQQLALQEVPNAYRESYMLSYMLDIESQEALLNIKDFIHPFDYKLNIATGTVGETKPVKVDMVETFNYLLGLRVQTMHTIRGFRVVTGLSPTGERTLIIWRDLEEKSNADLEAFFRKQDYNPRDMEFDLIYVNGDNNLENLRRPDETWKVRLIEEEFLGRMFDTEGM